MLLLGCVFRKSIEPIQRNCLNNAFLLKTKKSNEVQSWRKIDKRLLLSAYTEELHCLISVLRLIIKFLA